MGSIERVGIATPYSAIPVVPHHKEGPPDPSRQDRSQQEQGSLPHARSSFASGESDDLPGGNSSAEIDFNLETETEKSPGLEVHHLDFTA